MASLVGLSLVGTAQGAAGGGGGNLPTPTVPAPLPHYVPTYAYGGPSPDATAVTCATPPSLSVCNNKSYANCPNFEVDCKPIVTAAGATYAASTTSTCLMDATGDHCVPVQSKAYPATYKTNPGTDWPAQEAAAMRNALVALSATGRGSVPVNPATWVRNASWADKTKPIDSCEAYIYAKYYDYERFLDASYACGNDDQCVFDMAFLNIGTPSSGAPRIAKRKLLDRDGAVIQPSQVASEGNDASFMLTGGADVLPKNTFYAAAAFMPPAVFDALIAAWASDPVMVSKLQTLRTQLAKGYNFYDYGNAPGLAVEYHHDFWTWNQTMSNRTKPKAYAHAQQAEFVARNEKVAGDIWAVGSALACASLSLPCVAMPVEVARVTPGMAESYPADPFGMASLLTKNDRFSTALQGAFESTLVPSQIPDGGFGVDLGAIGTPFGIKTLSAKTPGAKTPARALTGTAISSTRRLGLAPAGGIISTGVPPLRPTWDGFPADYWTKPDFSDPAKLQYASYTLQRAWVKDPPVVESGRGAATHPRLDCKNIDASLDPVRSAACTLANTVLDEWSRSLAGNESCLDMNGYACDWSPLEFRQSVLGSQRMQASRQADYKECVKYTHNDFSKPGAPQNQYTAVRYAYQDTWEHVKLEIDKLHAAVDKFNQKVPIIESPEATSFSHVNANETVYGEHTHDIQQWGNDLFGAGYHYEIGWDAAVLARDANHKITRMQLGFDGNFEAHASAFGNDITLLDAELGARLNYDDQGRIDAKHYLYIIGFGSFDGLKQKEFGDIGGIAQSFQLADPHDSFEDNVFDAGFWVGPVYVHVGVDVEFFYDAPLEGDVKMPTAQQPLASNALIEGTLSFGPKAGVNADLYAYGGWGPIAEAGLEAKLNLITVGLPMKSTIGVTAQKQGGGPDLLFFGVHEGIDVAIDTLSGEVDVCGKIIGIGGCAKMVSWKGLHQQFPLFTPVEEQILITSLN